MKGELRFLLPTTARTLRGGVIEGIVFISNRLLVVVVVVVSIIVLDVWTRTIMIISSKGRGDCPHPNERHSTESGVVMPGSSKLYSSFDLATFRRNEMNESMGSKRGSYKMTSLFLNLYSIYLAV